MFGRVLGEEVRGVGQPLATLRLVPTSGVCINDDNRMIMKLGRRDRRHCGDSEEEGPE